VLLLSTAHISFGQILSPGESLIVIPTAEMHTDATLTIGYGQVPNLLAAQPAIEAEAHRFTHEVYLVSLQFIPRVTLHFRSSFRNEDGELDGEDRMLGVKSILLRERRNRPGLAVGVRDIAGTRLRHASYAVLSKGFDFGPVRTGFTVGYSKQILDARGLEMKDGPFYGVSISGWNRAELMLDYDTRFYYAGARVWPLKWIWVTGFAADWEHSGFAFGISRVLFGSDS